jgi:hypothetical protein
MAVRLSALRTGRPLSQEDSWYSFLLDWVDPNAIVQLEGLGQLKNKPMTSSGIEPKTLRLAALCLDALRYCVSPERNIGIYIYIYIYFFF